MKKPIAVIGLVFGLLVFASCGDLKDIVKTGGTIKVKNKSANYSVNIYITKSAYVGLAAPTGDQVVAKKQAIAAGDTGSISIDKDGIYYINSFFNMPETAATTAFEARGTVDPIVATLGLGNTVPVEVDEILPIP